MKLKKFLYATSIIGLLLGSFAPQLAIAMDNKDGEDNGQKQSQHLIPTLANSAAAVGTSTTATSATGSSFQASHAEEDEHLLLTELKSLKSSLLETRTNLEKSKFSEMNTSSLDIVIGIYRVTSTFGDRGDIGFLDYARSKLRNILFSDELTGKAGSISFKSQFNLLEGEIAPIRRRITSRRFEVFEGIGNSGFQSMSEEECKDFVRKEIPRVNEMLEGLRDVFSSMQDLTERVIESGIYKHIKPVKLILNGPHSQLGVS